MEIEASIPIPEKRLCARTEASNLARQMKVGESILCESEAQRETARWKIKQLGGRCATRRVDGGWRVWRIG